MTETSLRGHSQQKETIHDYIILMGVDNRGNIEGKYVNTKETYVDYYSFRKILQEYDYPYEAIESSGSRNMKCFIDAANTKYEVVNNKAFYEYAFPTSIGAIMGMILTTSLVNCSADWLFSCFRTSPYIYYTATIIGAISGGIVGYKIEGNMIEHALDHQAFVNEAHVCYDNMHPIGEIAASEVEVNS